MLFRSRNLIAAAVALWSGMTALSGLAANMWHLTLARIGVGIGEAGCSPPAHSIIADLYPPEKRSSAMGFYTLGISAGVMMAYLAGGWVVQNIGWREAFYIVGIPGLVLALIVTPEGFPLTYEVFPGNRLDRTTLEHILDTIETKFGKARRLWVFDRGIVSEDNLELLQIGRAHV